MSKKTNDQKTEKQTTIKKPVELKKEDLEEISGGPTPIYMSINDTGFRGR